MTLILVIAVVAALLILNELWFRFHKHPGEFSRKFIHISVGSFVAFWPFYLEWWQITALSIAFVIVVSLSKYLNVFKAIHSVQRPTYGELCFALAVGVIALVTDSKAIYAVALLQMSLADGLAAIVGTRFGKNNQYKVWGGVKSLAGTATFFVVSLALLSIYSMYSGAYVDLPLLMALAAAASAIENLAAYGTDNLLVPLLVAAALGTSLF